MFARLFNIVSAIALATLLAGGTFIGYLSGTGRLNGDRLERIAGVLRGELDQPLAPPEPAASPATAPAARANRAEPPGSTESELREVRKRQQLEALDNERAVRDLAAQRQLLDQVLQHVVQEQERLARRAQSR